MEDEKKPFYKRWWFIVLVVVIIAGALQNQPESDDGISDMARQDSLRSVETAGEDSRQQTQFKPEQVGYFKGDNRLRYFTFFVPGYEDLEVDSTISILREAITEHGSRQMNTSGQITASFYYAQSGQAPDITIRDAQRAENLAHERKPFLAVWIMPTGQVNVIERPE